MSSSSTRSNWNERDAIIAAVRAAFANVTLGEHGISWNECEAIDNYEWDGPCDAIRQSMSDVPWSELVDDPDWRPFPGMGGFSFINVEGFRYYLAPTMIRFLRGDNTEWYPGHLLGVIEMFTDRDALPLWSTTQLQCIARFISFMARQHNAEEGADGENPWAEALTGRWRGHLPETTP